MKTKIKIVYSSHLTDDQNTEFEKHVSETIGVDHSIHLYCNYNQFSLTEIYNKAIIEHASSDSIMIFIHNDLYFDRSDWGKILLKHFNNPSNDYQIIGVAGSKSLYSHGCWWMNENKTAMNSDNMIGIVNHDNGVRKWESKYSEPYYGVKPVVLIDGLFMAVDTDEIESKFDESFKGFHMYDVSFCIENYLDGCNIGVITDVRITHKSIGQTNQEWENNRIQFVEKYKNELPIII